MAKYKVFPLYCKNVITHGNAYKVQLKTVTIYMPQSWVKEMKPYFSEKTKEQEGVFLLINEFWRDKILQNITNVGGTVGDMVENPKLLPKDASESLKNSIQSDDPTENFVNSLQTDKEYWLKAINDNNFNQILVNLLKMHHLAMKQLEEKDKIDEEPKVFSSLDFKKDSFKIPDSASKKYYSF
jgi:hypothetical protein